EASGPGGPGMAQRWIEEPSTGVRVGPDPVDVHPLSDVPDDRVAVLRGEGAGGEEVVVAHAVTPRIRRAALFDLVINNADRKGGHLLVDSDGEVWAIDHGLAFHTEPKLRTVLWGWAGTPLPDEDRAGLDSVLSDLSGSGALHRRLTALLAHEEIEALAARVASIIDDGEFPRPGPGSPSSPPSPERPPPSVCTTPRAVGPRRSRRTASPGCTSAGSPRTTPPTWVTPPPTSPSTSSTGSCWTPATRSTTCRTRPTSTTRS